MSDSSFLDKSGDSVVKSVSNNQRTTDQNVGTPISQKQSLLQFEFVPRLTTDTSRMDRGGQPY